jgi:hypothetical protein
MDPISDEKKVDASLQSVADYNDYGSPEDRRLMRKIDARCVVSYTSSYRLRR